MKPRLRRPAAHRSAVALVTVASTLGIAGCSVFSPAIIHEPYDPSDGIGTAVGDVAIRNALVVSSGIDEPGVLSVVFVNSGDDEATVGVSVDVDAGSAPAQTFTVPAGATVQIGDPSAGAGDTTVGEAIGGPAQQSGWVQIPQVPVLPGQTVPMTFTVAGTDRAVEAPVVLPCFEYALLTPTPAPVPPTAGAG
ncbi:hypothetical protein GTQ99_07440, partial [Kineococcus sp. T13]|uniref:hypothetical protein n=1 Tax=Kineococcus vitellinus TaxID=2696565 RepID=UPI001411DB22